MKISPPVPSKLVLNCSPPRIPLGNKTSCEATLEIGAGSTFTVQSWSYSGTAVPTAPTGDAKVWKFTPGEVASGTVTITALVNGAQQTATAQLDVVCNFFKNPPADPLLQSARVQQDMQNLWNASDPQNPQMFDRQERGGWIVSTNGELAIVPFSNAVTDRCTLTIPWDEARAINNTPGREVRAVIHTHPHEPGTYPNPGNCKALPGSEIRVEHGMSRADRSAAEIIPSYVIDGDHVHRWTREKRWYNSADTDVRSNTCNLTQP